MQRIIEGWRRIDWHQEQDFQRPLGDQQRQRLVAPQRPALDLGQPDEEPDERDRRQSNQRFCVRRPAGCCCRIAIAPPVPS